MSITEEMVLIENMGEVSIQRENERLVFTPRPEYAEELISVMKKLQAEYNDLTNQIRGVAKGGDEYRVLLMERGGVSRKIDSWLQLEYNTTTTETCWYKRTIETITHTVVEGEDVPEAGLCLKATAEVHLTYDFEEDLIETTTTNIAILTDGIKSALELATEAFRKQYLRWVSWCFVDMDYRFFDFYTVKKTVSRRRVLANQPKQTGEIV